MNMSNRNFRENIARTSSEDDVTSRVKVRCRPGLLNIKQSYLSVNFKAGTLNVGTMKGRVSEIRKTAAR